MKNKNFETSCGLINIRIDIDWKKADVDVVYSEVKRMFPTTHTVKSKTPTSSSVDVLLEKLFEEFKGDPYNKNTTQWQKRGIEYNESNGLMQGNASVVFEIDLRKTPINTLPEVVEELKKVVSKFTSKIVKYYKPKTELKSGIGFTVVS